MDYLLHCSIISVASRTPPQNMECRPVEKSEDIGSILCNLGSFTSSLWDCLALLLFHPMGNSETDERHILELSDPAQFFDGDTCRHFVGKHGRQPSPLGGGVAVG